MRSSSDLTPCLAALLAAALLAAALLPGCGGTTDPACSATPQTFTASAAWQAIGPSQWANACSIEVKAPALAADERLAVLLVNAAGTNQAATTLSASGAVAIGEAPGPRAAALETAVDAETAGASPRDDASPIAIQQASLARWLSGPATAEARRARGAVRAAAAAVPATRTFCTYVLPGFTTWTRKSATLMHESATAAYYATDDVKAGLADLVASMPTTSPGFWARMDSYYEGIADAAINPGGAKNIRGALVSAFGGESDYDGNGKMIFLFTDLSVRSTSGSSFVAGYFDPNDIQAADATTGCTASGATQGSNAADMLYLMDPVHYVSMGYALDSVVNSELPSVMAHELQHDALFNSRCVKSGVTARCAASGVAAATGDLWLNEGLSMVAEDVAGFGMNTASGRSRVAAYLSCASSGSHTCHETASLTAWPTPGDPYGNYGAVHAFLRWHLDQRAKVSASAALGFTQALSSATVTARDAVATASGLTFEEGSARFASAALFSGWSADPAPTFGYAADQAWSPFHTRVAWPSYHPLGATPVQLTLRTDAWQAWQTGPGSGAEATVSLTAAGQARPTLVVARVKAPLGTP